MVRWLLALVLIAVAAPAWADSTPQGDLAPQRADSSRLQYQRWHGNNSAGRPSDFLTPRALGNNSPNPSGSAAPAAPLPSGPHKSNSYTPSKRRW